ncbi:3'(2'),5'-bisphosphate nucleotidase CysQ [Pannus brasiliensis CCIBt3594]|uniref:inositol-phosphate phosphatase n=1 Tax=Pannus brasiliensis CCIBt3594 TaxID=1427578 RepID=A0AAW9QR21_9CHRO
MTNLEIPDNRTLDRILDVTRAVGRGAAKILRSYYRGEKNLTVNEDKKDGPVTAADIAANHYILEKLQATFGEEKFGYLSEETHQGSEPIAGDLVWIIDPLDGTRDFIEKTGEYALHIALCYQGRPIIAVVAVPEAEKLYFAAKGQGTHVEAADGTVTPLQVSHRERIEDLYLVASRTHRDRRFDALLARLPFKGQNYVGSVGCKISTILEHRSDVYISLSGKSAAKDWDFAAPELILTEAGGKFTYFDGTPVRYNRGDVCQWGGIMASNGHCHDELCRMATEILEEIDSKS